MLPLLIISGASGTGKSTLCHSLLGKMDDVVLLDSDILWRPEFANPENGFHEFFELWLRVCKNISQSGRPVVLFGAGVGVSHNLESCIEMRYFSSLNYLALTCDSEVLAERLRKRPAWRESSNTGYIEEHTRFNDWFKTNARTTTPHIDLLDTTSVPIATTRD